MVGLGLQDLSHDAAAGISIEPSSQQIRLASEMTNEHTARQALEPETLRTWRVGSTDHLLGAFPWIMGILNATPDSFSDGGQFLDEKAAVAHALGLVADGADIVDIGGESTRPGSQPVELEEELRRVLPVVRRLAKETKALISIDTTKAEVARQAIEAGADIVNDISGLRFDEQMAAVCRDSQAAVICMHMQGTPQTMQDEPTYKDAVTDIGAFFDERLKSLERAGIERERIVLDPGVGFGKTAAHNLELLSAIERFRALGRPVLIGHSRKRFLSKVLNRDVEERTSGTIGVAVALTAQHTDIIRVHDVRAVRDAITAWQAVTDRIV
jgi:dihydropteroate synthase